MKNIYSIVCLTLLGSLAIILSGCSSFETEERVAMPLPGLSCVAVLPVAVPVNAKGGPGIEIPENEPYIDFNSNVDTQHTLLTGNQVTSFGGCAVTADKKQNLLDGAAHLDSVFTEQLGGQSQYQLLTEEQLDAILSDPWGGQLKQVRDIGQATGCGGVLETTISRYRQRVGSSMSADVPASAAFSMELVAVANGIVAWSTSFDETQQSLSTNIFSFGKAKNRGFKWLTVEELIQDGLKERLADFPYFKEDDDQ